jgi:hypothetical protein
MRAGLWFSKKGDIMTTYYEKLQGITLLILVCVSIVTIFSLLENTDKLKQELRDKETYISFLESKLASAEIIEPATLILADTHIDFLSPDGRVLATLNWEDEIVRLSGSMDTAASVMFRLLGERIAKECGGKK